MDIEKTLDLPQVTIWHIDQPPVTARDVSIAEITFKPGDTISVTAGGCVQTGGHGKTWKRYVNPSGGNSDHLYHGLIGLPGMGLTRVSDFINGTKKFTVPSGVGDMTLHLGYEDDGYADNGYNNPDDGTEDQCKGVGPAYVQIVVMHP